MGGKASTQPASLAASTPTMKTGSDAQSTAPESKSGVKRSGQQSQQASTTVAPSAAQTSPQTAAGLVAPASGGEGGGFMKQMAGSVATGMATGVGMSAADRAMDAVLGPRQVEIVHKGEATLPPPPPPPPKRCQPERDQLSQCVNHNSHIEECQSYFDAVKRCEA
eukprot:TRINITY_DN2569_c0_g1_i2.p1 TRINITY_DN2569_c0_g1~~TRINITY_DN2569_c0_g1_i2.p1  ORF type:complete len:165 (-),score=23.53 TRINITY_DN2569_c0_g1_i2:137-631(-)